MRKYFHDAIVAVALLAAAAPGASFGASASPAATDSYTLGPGDKVAITVFNEPDLTRRVEVAADGSVSFPLVGQVPASGATLAEFSDKLSSALRTYLKNARVTAEVAEYRPFSIIGEVRAPGTYPYAPNLTVISAVARAGGFTYRASKTTVFITRANDTRETKVKLSDSTIIRAGDIIRISERMF
jgi:polysaccharide export outer membrane protein